MDLLVGIHYRFHVNGKNAAGDFVGVTGVTATAANATVSVNGDGTNGVLVPVAPGPGSLSVSAATLSASMPFNVVAPAPDMTPVSLHIEFPG